MTMGSLALTLLMLFCGCSGHLEEPQRQISPAPQVIKADYAHRAFGGNLLGTDRGEWIGELLFQSEDGGVERILHENIHGIVENRAGIFVFTGVHHMGINDGSIYIISRTSNNDVVATRLGRIPGAPRDVTQHPGGTTTFLVATERYDLQGRTVYECYALTGEIVERSSECLPPKSAGTSHPFKPAPLRRLAYTGISQHVRSPLALRRSLSS